jgi:hypothetical protein
VRTPTTSGLLFRFLARVRRRRRQWAFSGIDRGGNTEGSPGLREFLLAAAVADDPVVPLDTLRYSG